MLSKVISGGQTGVDCAALRAAAACGVERGGWCPPGRESEDGPIPAGPAAERARDKFVSRRQQLREGGYVRPPIAA